MTLSSDICPQCGTALDSAGLGGMCPRCVALEVFNPQPEPASGAGEHLRYFGDYELLEEIARGGMGVVYKARHVSLGRIVAVKMILQGALADDKAIARFHAEAKAAAGLQHRNIVAIHEIGQHEGHHYFSMEYVAGRTLQGIVREGPLPARRAAGYVQRMAEAVHYAHSRGVLHRDLKPSNVLIDEGDEPRVTDFGLAKRLDAADELTLSGQMLGTPAYMPPEQASPNRSSRPVLRSGTAESGREESHSARAPNAKAESQNPSEPLHLHSPQSGHGGRVGCSGDVYSLGAILYHLLTGRPPFTGASVTDILRQVTDAEPVAPRLLNPGFPRDLETICIKCLEKEPSRRYASAAELGEDLGRFLRDEPIRARPVTPLERGWRWCKRKPALATALAGIVLLLTGIALTSSLSARRIDGLRLQSLTNLYAADMRLAQQAIAENKFGLAMGLLERHLPRRGEPDLRGFEWRHFYDQCRSDEVVTLGAHQDQAQCAVFSPDGRLVATGGNDVRVWDVATRALRFTRPGESYIRALTFSPDGRRLAVGEYQGRLSCLDVETGREVAGRMKSNDEPFVLQWLTNGPQVTVWSRGRRAVWDLASGQWRSAIPLPDDPRRIGPPAVSEDGLFVVMRRPPWQLELWQLDKLLAEFPVDNVAVAAAISRDGLRLAAGEFSGALNLFERAPTARTNRFPAHHGLINKVVFSPDGQRLATGGADQVIRVWDFATGTQLTELRGHRRTLWALAFSPDGDWLVSGDMSGEVKLWHTRTNRHESTKVDRRYSALSADGEVWTMCDSNSIRLIRHLTPDEPGRELPLVFENGPAINLPSTNGVVWRNGDGPLIFLGPDLQPSAVKLPLVLTNSMMYLSPNGRFLIHHLPETKATAAWDLALARHVWEIPVGDFGMRALAISGDSQLAALGSGDGKLLVLALATGRVILSRDAHRAATYAVDFSPDHARLATAGIDGTVKLWETATGRMLAEFRSNVESFWTVALSPDGRRVAAGTLESTVVLWDVPSRQEVATFKLGGPMEPVEGVLRFTPDGTALLLAHGTLRRWAAPPLTR